MANQLPARRPGDGNVPAAGDVEGLQQHRIGDALIEVKRSGSCRPGAEGVPGNAMRPALPAIAAGSAERRGNQTTTSGTRVSGVRLGLRRDQFVSRS